MNSESDSSPISIESHGSNMEIARLQHQIIRLKQTNDLLKRINCLERQVADVYFELYQQSAQQSIDLAGRLRRETDFSRLLCEQISSNSNGATAHSESMC